MKPVYAHLSDEWPNYGWDRERFSPVLPLIHFRRDQIIEATANIGFE